MRELKLLPESSTSTSLVFVDDTGEQFFVAVDENVREIITAPSTSDEPDEAANTATAAEQAAETLRSLPEPDPLYSAPLSMRPREIQARIRAGASPDELADEMGVAVTRIESYAHPVLLERAQIAQLARSSHPIREDGPAKLTLAEVLAAAFGARGHSLADATWDAFKEPDGEWIVRVSWKAGLSENEAEWIFQNHSTSQPTTEPLNAVAADLTDPDFVQPVRSLTSVSRGTRYEEAIPAHRQEELGEDASAPGEEDVELTHDSTPEDEGGDDDSLLQNPEPGEDSRPKKRRRKAITPHWEDVLLGVRSNTKRPRG